MISEISRWIWIIIGIVLSLVTLGAVYGAWILIHRKQLVEVSEDSVRYQLAKRFLYTRYARRTLTVDRFVDDYKACVFQWLGLPYCVICFICTLIWEDVVVSIGKVIRWLIFTFWKLELTAIVIITVYLGVLDHPSTGFYVAKWGAIAAAVICAFVGVCIGLGKVSGNEHVQVRYTAVTNWWDRVCPRMVNTDPDAKPEAD